MWEKTQKVVEPIDIGAELTTTPYVSDAIDQEGYIRKHLAEAIVQKLARVITYEKSMMPMTGESKYRAKIRVVPQDITSQVVDHYVYKIQDIEFTHKQIEEAVLKQYPEYFL